MLRRADMLLPIYAKIQQRCLRYGAAAAADTYCREHIAMRAAAACAPLATYAPEREATLMAPKTLL